MDGCSAELIPLRTSGTSLPVFCIHNGLRGGLAYEQLIAALPVDQSIYGLCPPPGDTPAFRTVEELAAMYLQEVHKIQKHGPYQLLGWSFGGLVAYEMATLLVDRGEEVGLIALIDMHQPAFLRKVAKTADFRIQYLESRAKKYINNLFKGRIDYIWSDASQYAKSLVHRHAWNAVQRLCRMFNRPVPNIVRRDWIMINAILQSYTPKEFRGRLVLFRSEDRQQEFNDIPSLGWDEVAKGGVDVHIVPGDHVAMMQMPNVLILAKQLTPYLESVRARTSRSCRDSVEDGIGVGATR